MDIKIGNFNMRKLPEYISNFANKKVAIIGCGAVGSYLAEIMVKMGVIRLTLMDFDPFEAENIAKSSCAYRVPDDNGKNKAVILAKRLNEIIQCDLVHGIDANITSFGPMAFADFDVVLLALDNYAAKVFFNQIWLQIPTDERALLIMGGTTGESAQVSCLDGTEFCMRCLFDESWLDNMLKRTSCTGINYRNNELPAEIVRTTGLASRICSDIMAEQVRGHFLGDRSMVNTVVFYSPYPEMKIVKVSPMKRDTCPDCKNYYPPDMIVPLRDMDVVHTTVGELIKAIADRVGNGNFEIVTPFYEFAKSAYIKVIKDDYCRCCEKELKYLYKHEFRTKYSDLLCDKCREEERTTDESSRLNKMGSFIDAITPRNVDEILSNKPLFEVGYPIGGIIEVVIKGQDMLDTTSKSSFFYCQNDSLLMDTMERLEVK